MSGFEMPLGLALLAALAGVLAGYLHFKSLRAVSDRLASGQLLAVAIQIARLVAMALFLYLCARLGTPALLGAGAGVLIGRALVLRAARKDTP
ncbi:ATP synthase subunit I [Citreicella sp. C3M06]|uniref:N-ATPase subunit AtpR n=1 Tax=Citreicella sp. C3M06 TaxID=2841564 RepID=UPI00209057CE|nr:ATP synthase subunit I [Citreicella sp. C3M06]